MSLFCMTPAVTLVMVMLPCAAYAEALKNGTEIYPVRANGQRDWQVNHYRVENGEAVPIRPDGQRDWSANAYRPEGNRMVPVRPNGQRDWQAPALQVKGN